MEIRQLTLTDFDAFLELEGYAFHYVADEDRTQKVKKIWENSIALGAFSEEGRLQSALLIRPYDVFLHGKSVGMGGIGDVASYPEVRGQGNIRKLMKEALKVMRDRKMILSYLAPFSFKFYRKFGYELTFEKRAYTLKPSAFDAYEAENRNVRRIDWKEEKETLMSVYAQKYGQSIGPVNREEWAWKEKKRWLNPLHAALCTDETGRPEGYVIYHFKSDGTYVFKVDELVALTGEAEKALWWFVASHSPQFDRFEYLASSSDNLAYLFPEPDVEQKWQPGMMARIVDMETFLKEYPFKQTQNHTFLLTVNGDETAEWNNGSYQLGIMDQEVSVTKTEEQTDHPARMEADIQTWTQLFMGTRTAEELQFQGSLSATGQTAAAFQEVLNEGAPQLFDYF